MTRLVAVLEVELAVAPNVVNVAPRPAVGIPPTDADAIWDEMRVVVGGVLINRAYDPGDDIETGGPIGYVTTGGAPYVTLDGRYYVRVIQ